MKQLSLLTLVVLGAEAGGAEPAPIDAAAPPDDRAPEPDRIDHGDGTYELALDPDFDVKSTRVTGALTWGYVEQATFSWDPTPFRGEVKYFSQKDAPESQVDHLIGTRNNDSEGRVWEVVDVDADLLAKLAGLPVEEVLAVPKPDDAYDPEENTWVTWEPHGFSPYSCALNNTNTIWDPVDNRAWQGANSHDGRKAAIAKVGGCTGVFVRNKWVLTAAHCLFDGNNILYEEVEVCKRDDGDPDCQVRKTPEMFVNSDYSPGALDRDPDDDFALIRLQAWTTWIDPTTGTYDQAPEEMDMSAASEDTMKSIVNYHNLAYPACATYSTPNTDEALFSQGNGVLNNVYSGKLTWHIDSGPGHSGSPVFFCPFDDVQLCAASEKGHIVGLIAGYFPATTEVRGPRSSGTGNFRLWANDIMNSN